MWWDTAHEETCSKVEPLVPLENILGCWQGGNVETFSAAGQGFAKILPRQRRVYNTTYQPSPTVYVCECTKICPGLRLVLTRIPSSVDDFMSSGMEKTSRMCFHSVHLDDNCITTSGHPPRNLVENDECKQYRPSFSLRSQDTAYEELPAFLCQAQHLSLKF